MGFSGSDEPVGVGEGVGVGAGAGVGAGLAMGAAGRAMTLEDVLAESEPQLVSARIDPEMANILLRLFTINAPYF